MNKKEMKGNSPFLEKKESDFVLKMEAVEPPPNLDYRNRVDSTDSFGDQISPQKQLINGEMYGDLPGLQTPLMKKDSLQIRRDDQSMLIFRGMSGRFTSGQASNRVVLIGCVLLVLAVLSSSCMVPVMAHIQLPLIDKLVARNLLVLLA
jgi:hypothetical protein